MTTGAAASVEPRAQGDKLLSAMRKEFGGHDEKAA
jgi:6-phosphogluconate dehydrogenase (decarboxylating)